MLVAPLWGRGRQEILRDIGERFNELDTFQGRLYKSPAEEILHVE